MILATLSKDVIFKIIISLSVEKRRNRCLERKKLRLKETKLFHKNAQQSGRAGPGAPSPSPLYHPRLFLSGHARSTLGRVLMLSLKGSSREDSSQVHPVTRGGGGGGGRRSWAFPYHLPTRSDP